MLLLSSIAALAFCLPPLASPPANTWQGGIGGTGGGKQDGNNPPPTPPPVRKGGGTWGGPGDTVPHGDSPPPSAVTPGGSTTTGPGAGAPHSGGATAQPPMPGSAPGTSGIPRSPFGPGAPVTPFLPPEVGDPTTWSLWWTHNQAPYLELRKHVLRTGTLTGSDDFFLGGSATGTGEDEIVPAAGEVEGTVSAVLTAMLEDGGSPLLRMSLAMALARIGASDHEHAARLVAHLTDLLREPSQELAEVAVVALGVTSRPEALEPLLGMVRGDELGRALCNSTRVPERMRAFAAYALALLGPSLDAGSRATIVSTLMDVCEAANFSTTDVEAAALSAIGLLPIDERASLDTLQHAARAGEIDRRVLTRRTQIAWLLELFPSHAGHDAFAQVRAQIPIALARLARETGPSLRESLARVLLEALRPSAREPNEVRASVALALGELGDTDATGTDQEIRAALIREARDGHPSSRRFALIALGRLGGRPGDRDDSDAGLVEAREALLENLTHGRSQLEPWAALGLGLLAHGRCALGAPLDPLSADALRFVAEDTGQPEKLGAYAIALGLAHDVAAAPLLLERLQKIEASEVQAPLALALGLLGDTGALEALRTLLASSYAQPELFVDVAEGLALMGDKQVVPGLLDTLHRTDVQATQVAVCMALARVGDARALDALLELVQRADATAISRAAAARALGGICDRRSLPWETPISVGANYLATVPTLTDGQRGVLDYE